MPTPRTLRADRHDKEGRALITVAGELDVDTVPRLRESLDRCLRDGLLLIDVDLTAVSFCDCSGLNAFLRATRRTTALGGSLRLHHPTPTLARLFALTRTDGLLLALPEGPPPTRVAGTPAPTCLVPESPARPATAGSGAPVLLAATGGAR